VGPSSPGHAAKANMLVRNGVMYVCLAI
jgi:hypothetical protein